MVNDHINQFLFIRCIVLYNRKQEIHKGMSMFLEISKISTALQKGFHCYPGDNNFINHANSFIDIDQVNGFSGLLKDWESKGAADIGLDKMEGIGI